MELGNYKLVSLSDEQPKVGERPLVLFECVEDSPTGIRITEHPIYYARWNGSRFEYQSKDKYQADWKDALQTYVDTLLKNPRNVRIDYDSIKWFKKID